MSEPDFSRTGAAVLVEAVSLRAPQVDKPSFRDRLESFFGLSFMLRRDPVEAPAQPPWNGVALLNFFRADSYAGFATGFLVKPDMVVTASHNIQMARPSSIGVFPGFDAQRNPVQGISGKSWAWDGARDISVIVIARAIPDLFSIQAPSTSRVRLAGYAYPYPDNGPRMTFGEGDGATKERRFQYRIGVRQGDSGAPVFVPGPGGERAVAIHSESSVSYPDGGLIGVGEPIDGELREILLRLEAQARQQIG